MEQRNELSEFAEPPRYLLLLDSMKMDSFKPHREKEQVDLSRWLDCFALQLYLDSLVAPT